MTAAVLLCTWFSICGIQEADLPDRPDVPARHCVGGAYVGPRWNELTCWAWAYDDPRENATEVEP